MNKSVSRRTFLSHAGNLALLSVLCPTLPAWAVTKHLDAGKESQQNDAIDLIISEFAFPLGGQTGKALAINNSIPGPIIRLKEGTQATIRVTNTLKESTSIHWHGLILPPEMDGVPGVSFAGIRPGETFTYRFTVAQSGTYWCHSHSGGQELLGVYAPIIIEPKEQEPFKFDRDYVVMLSDWSFESPMEIMGKLKKMASYYNYKKLTAVDFARDARKQGIKAALDARFMWSEMNMDPTDIADVTGATYTYLMNGMPSGGNWTGIFKPGEKVRLRFIDAGAMTFFDIRIPGLKMTLVQADGQNVQPIEIDEFRIGPGETYDFIVEPVTESAYTIFAEAMDRSGFVTGTLAMHEGMKAPIPERRKRPIRTMEDMGMDMGTMAGMPSSGAMTHGSHEEKSTEASPMAGHKMPSDMEGMDMSGAQTSSDIPGSTPVRHGPDHHGVGNASVAEVSKSRLHEPGLGLGGADWRVLVYTDLKSLTPGHDHREPNREIELHVTGNMDRYMWSFDGKKYSEAKTPIRFRYGERLRLTLVNDTMMEHPIHLHGMWMELENGAGAYKPRKHTIIIKPAERWSAAITADALGSWAFHCHLLLHMEMGMFRVVEVVKDFAENAA